MLQNRSYLLSHLQLHLVVFIWGFTAILGELITLEAGPLVWVRMGIAVVSLLLYFKFKKKSLLTDKKVLKTLIPVGFVIALHWVTFFYAIKISNVSLTLACMASAAFFTSFLEPLFFKKRIAIYEVVLGLVVLGALWMIFQAEPNYGLGMAIALLSAFLAALFNTINGTLVAKHDAAAITLYELASGWTLLTVYMLFTGKFTSNPMVFMGLDWFWLLLLGTVCTAFAFIVSVAVMKQLSPFTVVLTVNLEPIYGIILAFFIFGEKEQMTPTFYGAGVVIVLSVVVNGLIQKRKKQKLKHVAA